MGCRKSYRRYFMSSRSAATIVMAALTVGGKSSSWAQEVPAKASREKAVMAAQTKFYCNISALNPAERMHHKQLTEKLIAPRTQTAETKNGYKFHATPSTVPP